MEVILSFIAEVTDPLKGEDETSSIQDMDDLLSTKPLQLFLQAIRHNQDSGVDDWTRLMLHSVFLNSIDELQHFSSSNASNSTNETTSSTVSTSSMALIPTRRTGYPSDKSNAVDEPSATSHTDYDHPLVLDRSSYNERQV